MTTKLVLMSSKKERQTADLAILLDCRLVQLADIRVSAVCSLYWNMSLVASAFSSDFRSFARDRGNFLQYLYR